MPCQTSYKFWTNPPTQRKSEKPPKRSRSAIIVYNWLVNEHFPHFLQSALLMIKKFEEFFPRELLKMFRRIPFVWLSWSFFIISSDVIKKITFYGICELSLIWFEMHKWKLSSRSKSSPDVSSQSLLSGQLFVLTTLIFLIVASLFQFSSSRREKIAKFSLKSE